MGKTWDPTQTQFFLNSDFVGPYSYAVKQVLGNIQSINNGVLPPIVDCSVYSDVQSFFNFFLNFVFVSNYDNIVVSKPSRFVGSKLFTQRCRIMQVTSIEKPQVLPQKLGSETVWDSIILLQTAPEQEFQVTTAERRKVKIKIWQFSLFSKKRKLKSELS